MLIAARPDHPLLLKARVKKRLGRGASCSARRALNGCAQARETASSRVPSASASRPRARERRTARRSFKVNSSNRFFRRAEAALQVPGMILPRSTRRRFPSRCRRTVVCVEHASRRRPAKSIHLIAHARTPHRRLAPDARYFTSLRSILNNHARTAVACPLNFHTTTTAACLAKAATAGRRSRSQNFSHVERIIVSLHGREKKIAIIEEAKSRSFTRSAKTARASSATSIGARHARAAGMQSAFVTSA